MRPWRSIRIALGLLLALGAGACTTAEAPSPSSRGTAESGSHAREEPFVTRVLEFGSGSDWFGSAIAYGPYRDGQSPGGAAPSRAQLKEDLDLMVQRWKLLRVYGAGGPSEILLELIREHGLDMKVMLGVWIAVEERRDEAGEVEEAFSDAVAGNRREVETAVRLAAEFPEVVAAISVGNETQIAWSAHRSPEDILIDYVREVRARTTVPVTVADDFNFWNKPESRSLAREVDFVTTHAHPMWNGIQLENAVAWTREAVAGVQVVHPDHLVVLGETGWATRKRDEGEQGKLIKGTAGEAEQAVFHRTLMDWVRESRVPAFYFEAFDEKWKGGDHPDEVEKHWGLYRADRTPKPAVARDA